jgi:hypothetical protein
LPNKDPHDYPHQEEKTTNNYTHDPSQPYNNKIAKGKTFRTCRITCHAIQSNQCYLLWIHKISTLEPTNLRPITTFIDYGISKSIPMLNNC